MDTDQALVLITAIYAVATIVIVFENRKSNNLIMKEIGEMHRPIISVYFTVSKRLGVLRIRNTGDMIAERLSLRCDGVLFEENEYCYSREGLEKMLSSKINVGPGEYFDLGLGLPSKLVKQERPRVIRIEYYSGEEFYQQETEIAFSEYGWTRLEPGEFDNIEESLEKISKSINELKSQ